MTDKTDYDDEIDEEFEAAMDAEARAIDELNEPILAAARRWLTDARYNADYHNFGGFGGFGVLDLACAEIALCGAELRKRLYAGTRPSEIFAIFDRLRASVAVLTAVLDANPTPPPPWPRLVHVQPPLLDDEAGA
jgi:hypothetical protein